MSDGTLGDRVAAPRRRRDRPDADVRRRAVRPAATSTGARFSPPEGRADLPTYPFQRQRYWLEPAPVPQAPQHEQIGQLSYRVAWAPLPEPPLPEPQAPAGGRWLAVAASPEQLADVTGALRDSGLDCLGTVVDTATADRADLAGRWRTLAGSGEVDGVVTLLAWDERPHPQYQAVTRGLAATTVLLQALADAELPAPVWR